MGPERELVVLPTLSMRLVVSDADQGGDQQQNLRDSSNPRGL